MQDEARQMRRASSCRQREENFGSPGGGRLGSNFHVLEIYINGYIHSFVSSFFHST